jgi:hypothetical protein
VWSIARFLHWVSNLAYRREGGRGPKAQGYRFHSRSTSPEYV